MSFLCTLWHRLMSLLLLGSGRGAPGPAGDPPVNTVAPVASGTGEVGQTLSVTTGTWTGLEPITYSYQWQRDGVNIGGATNSTYTLVSGDADTDVRCVVTGTNDDGSSSANSNAISVLYPPVNTVAPVASGTGNIGQTLSVTTGTWVGTEPITYSYQWQRDGVNIGSATNNTYTLVTADGDTDVRCVVTGTNDDGSASANSNAISVVFTGACGEGNEWNDAGPYTSDQYQTKTLNATKNWCLRADTVHSSLTNSSGLYQRLYFIDGNNYLVGRWLSGVGLHILRVQGGTPTNLGAVAFTPSVDVLYQVSFSRVGTTVTYRVTQGGSLVAETGITIGAPFTTVNGTIWGFALGGAAGTGTVTNLNGSFQT